jgi:hypothetical protein
MFTFRMSVLLNPFYHVFLHCSLLKFCPRYLHCVLFIFIRSSSCCSSGSPFLISQYRRFHSIYSPASFPCLCLATLPGRALFVTSHIAPVVGLFQTCRPDRCRASHTLGDLPGVRPPSDQYGTPTDMGAVTGQEQTERNLQRLSCCAAASPQGRDRQSAWAAQQSMSRVEQTATDNTAAVCEHAAAQTSFILVVSKFCHIGASCGSISTTCIHSLFVVHHCRSSAGLHTSTGSRRAD